MAVTFNKLLYFFLPFLICWLFSLSQEVSSFSTASSNNNIATPFLLCFEDASTTKRSFLCTKKHPSRSFHSTMLFSIDGNSISNGDHNDEESSSSSSSSSSEESNNNVNAVPIPVASKYMTALEISHREQEIELLADLATTDTSEVIIEFRKLWRSERGSKTEEKILRAWKDLGHPDLWSQAEKSLLELIKIDPTYLYPFVFLSKLYCLQGRFQESQQVCESVLQIKPYHFVVIETMVANSFALQNQEQIQYWEMKRLPPPTQKQQRLEWVKQAIDDATQILEQAKESNVPRTASAGGDKDGSTLNSNDDYGIMLEQRYDCIDDDDDDDDDVGDGSTKNVWQ